MGKNVHRLLKFAIRYREGWHGYGKDRATVDAVKRLSELDLIQINEHRQFKLADAHDSHAIAS